MARTWVGHNAAPCGMTTLPSLTPMMQQYMATKSKLQPGTLLFFRLGDFYELFDEDAEVGAQILGITLTQRQGTPMAGIPYHAAESYVAKLLAAGKKVAFCEQQEAATPGKLVKRALTRILSPGTTLEDNQLDALRNHYILAMSGNANVLSLAWLDLTTGEFQLTQAITLADATSIAYAIDPREVLLPEGFWEALDVHTDSARMLQSLCQTRTVTCIAPAAFNLEANYAALTQALKVLTLEGFGIGSRHPGLGPAGALLQYATENLCSTPANLTGIREYKAAGSLRLDPSTLRNLEIFKSSTHTRKGSLLDAMDGTLTAAGARLLEQYLMSPSVDLGEIQRRQQCVGAFLNAPTLANDLQQALKHVRDIQRILSRLQNRLRSPRELGAIRDTLRQIPGILNGLGHFNEPCVQAIMSRIHNLDALDSLLSSALADVLPSDLSEGGYIQNQYNAELDELRFMSLNHKQWLAELEKKEQEASGIKSLKVKYNSAFGYFIEITKAQLHLVPSHYIRKQTITNGERYLTDELKLKEREILHAEEKSIAIEQELFKGLVEHVLSHSQQLMETGSALAELDVFLGWAMIARQHDYCCPEVNHSDVLNIREGRHPVIEQILRAESKRQRFVPNDTSLAASGTQIALITGPNMAGKSTYIRQVALIALMAHVGSWVPAKDCTVGILDRIFSRVGASDELAKGHSTFMLEMHETANILNHATCKSLIILDEIGRGTSTYDGVSIAWAVAEYLHRDESSGPKTLFATHYHELTSLSTSLPRLQNYCVAVKEWNDEIIFVHQVVPGMADKSYGIHVARLAGIPKSVIDRAENILQSLEGKVPTMPRAARTLKIPPRDQLEFGL